MSIDLSALPAPAVIEPLDYETIYQQSLVLFRAGLPGWTAAIESDSVVQALEVAAYRELSLRARTNEAWQQSTLAYATGNDLEHVAARVGVSRALITPADPSTNPPTPAVYESDARLRYRAQLAPEALAIGSAEYYTARALEYSGAVVDVHVYSPAPVEVRIVVQAAGGAPSAELLSGVQAYCRGERGAKNRSLTDHIIVEPAIIRHVSLRVGLKVADGPTWALIESAARAAFAAELIANDPLKRPSRLGQVVDKSAVYAAMRRPGVLRVDIGDFDDIICTPSEVPVIDLTIYQLT